MNFSPATIQAAAGYVSAVKRSLAEAGYPPDPQPVCGGILARAILWAGIDREELNALARIAGHPFAPDLPEWMTGVHP